MNARATYTLSALIVLLAVAVGILAVTTPARAGSGDHCNWTWMSEEPNEAPLVTYWCEGCSGDCWDICDDEESVCLDDCDDTPSACGHECAKVRRACVRACVPWVK